MSMTPSSCYFLSSFFFSFLHFSSLFFWKFFFSSFFFSFQLISHLLLFTSLLSLLELFYFFHSFSLSLRLQKKRKNKQEKEIRTNFLHLSFFFSFSGFFSLSFSNFLFQSKLESNSILVFSIFSILYFGFYVRSRNVKCYFDFIMLSRSFSLLYRKTWGLSSFILFSERKKRTKKKDV